MEIEKLTKEQIVLDTIEFYSKNPRSVNREEEIPICKYNDGKGNECAFARFVKEEYKERLRQYEGKVARHVLGILGVMILDERVNHIEDSSFWNSIQNLHDRHTNWDSNGLTQSGKEFCKIRFNLDL